MRKRVNKIMIRSVLIYFIVYPYIDGSCSVDRINCSLVIPVNRQRQSEGY